MKKLLGKKAKDNDGPSTESVHLESSSVHDIRPMFGSADPSSFDNDTELNLNPAITSGLIFTEASRHEQSLFSSKASYSTRQLSYQLNRSKKYPPASQFGQTLQILEAEEPKDDSEGLLPETIKDALHSLWKDIAYVANQNMTSVLNLLTTVVNMIECLKDFISFMDESAFSFSWAFDAYNNESVRKILKTFLHYYDNLLQDEAYLRLKLLFSKTFNEFNKTLKSPKLDSQGYSSGIPKPSNYAIGCNGGKRMANEAAVERIMHKIAQSSVNVADQNGAFIAPIARGISEDMTVLCLYFGYPSITDQHLQIVSQVHEIYDDIHVIVGRNRIELALMNPTAHAESLHKFKLPFRNPSDALHPPMSLSISVDASTRTSGTMGGFVYPIIDKKTLPHLVSYTNAKFAISCGHVCLDKSMGGSYPHISAPLAVLIDLYKKALAAELDKASQAENFQSSHESRVAYRSALHLLDDMFPPRQVSTHDPKNKKKQAAVRNLPRIPFGQIIWGERTLIQANKAQSNLEYQEKRLSDLAIIKVNKILQCDQNYLGSDVAFNEFDPALILDNLYVRQVLHLQRQPRENPFSSAEEIDSVVSTASRNADGSFKHSGLPVFKYGSTTKFTKGSLNGIKLVYWMDGVIHLSEFVVNSTENMASFAAGGDSGAWILTKLDDVSGMSGTKGLGVVGMLHSYDGEHRQFGLFTPMTEILQRLEEVTTIKWGVVGVADKAQDDSYSDVSSVSCHSASSESDYESGVEEQSWPPDID